MWYFLSMLTFVIPHKDRHAHLDVCLGSLAAQRVRPARVALCDYSVDRGATEALLKKWGGKIELRVLYGEAPRYQLNPARNMGRRVVKTPLMGVLDADISLGPELVARIVETFRGESGEPRRLILGATRMDLDESGQARMNAWTRELVLGSLQVFRVEDFDAVGGYNPFMEGWGADDTDFVVRLEAAGCEKLILDDEYVHQWHPRRDDPVRERRNIEIARDSFFDAGSGRWLRRSAGRGFIARALRKARGKSR